MRITYPIVFFQLFLVIPVLCLMTFLGCRRPSDELPIVPPVTFPLTREYIGYGVVTITFSHILSEPGPEGVSQGYIRRGTVLRIIERQQVTTREDSELWVLTEVDYLGSGRQQGWLQQAAIEIYDSEDKANTASRTMIQ